MQHVPFRVVSMTALAFFLSACAGGEPMSDGDAAMDTGIRIGADAASDMFVPPQPDPEPEEYPVEAEPFTVNITEGDPCERDNELPDGVAITQVREFEMIAKYQINGSFETTVTLLTWTENGLTGDIVLPNEAGGGTIRLNQVFWRPLEDGSSEGEIDQAHQAPGAAEPRRGQGTCAFRDDGEGAPTLCAARVQADSSVLMHGLELVIRSSTTEEERAKPFDERTLLFAFRLPTPCNLPQEPTGIHRPFIQWYTHEAVLEGVRQNRRAHEIWGNGGPYMRVVIDGPWGEDDDHFVRTLFDLLWRFTGIEPQEVEMDPALHLIPAWINFRDTFAPVDIMIRYGD